MTVNQLHKALTQLIEKGHKNKRVCVSKTTFHHNCEAEGVTILPVESIRVYRHWIDDGNGFKEERKDGSYRTGTSVVLFGNDDEGEDNSVV